MKKILLQLLNVSFVTMLCAFSCMAFTTQLAELPVTIQIKNFGLYTLLDKPISQFKPESTAGYASVINVSLLRETEKIPIKKGRLFGFQYMIQDMACDEEWVPVSIHIKHPETYNYLGQSTKGFTEKSYARLKPDGHYHNGAFYVLNETYEMIAGDWTISVIYKKKILVSKTFHVVDVNQSLLANPDF